MRWLKKTRHGWSVRKVSLSELLKRREIERVEPDAGASERLLRASEAAILAAQDNLGMGHGDVALSLAYGSMLNAGRALMAAKGYRPSSDMHHKAVVNFCAAMLPQSSELVSVFNRYRTRRHDIVYGEIELGSVGEGEAGSAIANAKAFLELVKGKLYPIWRPVQHAT